MERNGVVVRCDEHTGCDILIKRFKKYDRRLSRQTLGKFEHISDLMNGVKGCRGDRDVFENEVIDEVGSCSVYVRCIIRSRTSMIFPHIDTLFYDCVFVDTDSICGVSLHGENLSVRNQITVSDCMVFASGIVVNYVTLEQFNEILCDEGKMRVLNEEHSTAQVDNWTIGDYLDEVRKISEKIGTTIRLCYLEDIIMSDVD